jgi:hypothetical protein
VPVVAAEPQQPGPGLVPQVPWPALS